MYIIPYVYSMLHSIYSRLPWSCTLDAVVQAECTRCTEVCQPHVCAVKPLQSVCDMNIIVRKLSQTAELLNVVKH
jgi:hypothetical protein